KFQNGQLPNFSANGNGVGRQDKTPVEADPNGCMVLLKKEKPEMEPRGQWSNKMEFMLSMAGEIISLGNSIKPRLLFFLETALGQYTSQGGVTAWRKICPLFEGIGYASQVIESYLNIYYIVILASASLSLLGVHGRYSCTSVLYRKRVLGLTDGIHNLGTVRWELALCLLFAWVICYFCIWKGVKSTGKVWMDAGTQIFFSYAICQGCLTALGSYNKYNNNCYRDCFMLCFLNSATSFVAGFAIFSVLGFMAQEQGVPISEVGESGRCWPTIHCISKGCNGVSQVWSCLFFLMLIFLGLDSQRSLLLCHLALCAVPPSLSLVFVFVQIPAEPFSLAHTLLLSPPCLPFLCLTQGGMYIFQLFDYYAASGTCLLFLAIFEAICVGWVYGADRFYNNIEDMIGYRQWPLFKMCWQVVTPDVCLVGTNYGEYTPLKYNNWYVYSPWGYILGWLMALSSMICIPLYIIFILLKTGGSLKKPRSSVTKHCVSASHWLV
uniref:Uncharacterized protein n=1 Tax=Gopherus evgoodei TaxID=1825980 RepID=A0A8C4YM10_9SAUR